MKPDLFDIKGKRVLLLNADKPYGREIAQGLSSLGAKITLCGPNEEAMQAQAKNLGLQKKDVIFYELGTETAAESLANRVSQQIGAPDAFIYINPGSELDSWTPEFNELYESLRISQLGLMLTVKHIGLLMAKAERGAVLFITDYGALVGYDPENYLEEPELFRKDFALDRGFTAGSYVNYARQAAGFLGEHNIRCNVLAFGPLQDGEHTAFSESAIRHNQLKRLLSPDDLAAAAAFFISDASSFITGVTLPVDGGYTAK